MRRARLPWRLLSEILISSIFVLAVHICGVQSEPPVRNVLVNGLAVLKTSFDFALGSPSLGIPGEGPDCHFPKVIYVFGPIPARIWG